MLTRRIASLALVFVVAACTTNFDVNRLPVRDASVDAVGGDTSFDVPMFDATEAAVDGETSVTPETGPMMCATGLTLCVADGGPASGRCIDLQNDETNCGACGTVCPARTAGQPACQRGMCTVRCDGNRADCNARMADGTPNPAGMADGCEVDLQGDPQNCGACGNVCPSGPNSVATCAQGRCRLTCMGATRRNCDDDPLNGCEADTQSDAANCAMCGNACPAALNARGVCTDGFCGIQCRPGYGDCDGNAVNGCETRLDVANACGACTTRCMGTTPFCSANAMGTGVTCTGSCPADRTSCSGACVDLRTDPANCGACGTACPTIENGRATCMATVSGASCGAVCDAGFHLCGGRCVSNTDAASCGPTSCTPCPSAPNAVATCSGAGTCGIRCTAGFADCDGNAANGCEVNLATDLANCGSCRNTCAPAAMGGVCLNGTCGTSTTCPAGRGNCDGNAANGCETDLNTATANCGVCGTACTAPNGTPSCVAGVCRVAACNAGFANCDGNATNGCETNATSSPMHCGGCMRACTGTTSACVNGVCTAPMCVAPTADCDPTTPGCETNTSTSLLHCGACGQACSRPNATTQCRAGMCAIASCTAGFQNCDNNPSNGCEANTLTSLSHCGACNSQCTVVPNAQSTCVGGTCMRGACNAGWADCDANPTNGCETDLGTVSNCGTCGNACTMGSQVSSMICTNGGCSIGSCNPNFANCDGITANGCETNLLNNLNSCGACGVTCPTPVNGFARCIGGMCVAQCSAGFGDCDGNTANGCETNLNDDPSNCGVCRNSCGADQRCFLGTCCARDGCVTACPPDSQPTLCSGRVLCCKGADCGQCTS